MKKVIDFDKDFKEDKTRINRVCLGMEVLKADITQDACHIERLQRELEELAKEAGIDLPINTDKKTLITEWDNQFYLDGDWVNLEKKIKKEVMLNPELLPSLSKMDWAVVGLAGVIAAILDFLVVRIPRDMNYMQHIQQKGSGFTERLKSLGVNDEGKLTPFLQWCEDRCKVPYDTAVIKEAGVYPRNHRLRSLAHDPLFGLIFGIFDIWNGSVTYFDKQGKIHITNTMTTGVGDTLLAPLIWIGHLISDVCTKQGLPIPGWGFLQLLQFGSFGSKDRTIAQISEWMYFYGYDLRHFMTMSIVPASVEIIVRGYHGLSLLQDENSMFNPVEMIAEKEIKVLKNNLKLHKMLCLAHATAATGNALKVWAYQGNPTAINITQWMMLVKESINMLTAVTRDTTTEKLVRNRDVIDITWEELRSIKIGKNLE